MSKVCVGIPESSEYGKNTKATYHTYLAVRGQLSCTPNVEHLIGKTLTFCSKNSGPILITSWSHDKKIPGSSRHMSNVKGRRQMERSWCTRGGGDQNSMKSESTR